MLRFNNIFELSMLKIPNLNPFRPVCLCGGKNDQIKCPPEVKISLFFVKNRPHFIIFLNFSVYFMICLVVMRSILLHVFLFTIFSKFPNILSPCLLSGSGQRWFFLSEFFYWCIFLVKICIHHLSRFFYIPCIVHKCIAFFFASVCLINIVYTYLIQS